VALGLGEEVAYLALAALHPAAFEGVEGVGDVLGGGVAGGVVVRGDGDGFEGAGEQGAGGVVGGGIKRVGGGGGVGEDVEELAGGEAVDVLGMLDQLLGGELAGGVGFGQDEGAEEDAFGLAGGIARGGRADAFDFGGGGLADLLAKDGGFDAELLGGVGGELVAMEGVGHAADVGEEEVHGLDFGFGGAGGEDLAGAIDEVVGVAFGAAEGGHVGVHAAFADEAVRVKAVLEGDDLDLEALFGEQGDGFFGGGGAGLIGVEVDDDAVGEAGEEADLVFGEGGAGGGKDVADAGHVDGDAVHLAFDEEGEVVRAHVGLGFVEVEEDVALREERRLRGVHVLGDGAALVVGLVEGAGGEGDDLASFVGDGEGDAFAEAGVHLAL